MRTGLLLFILPVVAAAQINVEITGATPTQAVLQIRGATSPCTIDLREGSPEGPLHPDVTGAIDVNRPDTITWQDGTRVVTLGHRRSNLALATATDYFGTVSECGSATFQFRTALPPMGATMALPLPVNPDTWDNADFPQVDFTAAGRDKWYVDPMTGIKVKLVNRPEDFSRKRQYDDVFPMWAGGLGWTDPAKAASGSVTNYAATGNTNPLFLYMHPVDPFQPTNALENVGVLIWGACEGGSAPEDCDIEVGITTNPAEGFTGTPLRITLPTGAVKKVPGGSAHAAANGAFPTEYPKPLFAGWGNVSLTRDQYALSSAFTVTSAESGVLTIASPTKTSFFQRSLRPGHHIWVQDSGCSDNGAPDVCTVASFANAGSLALQQTHVNLTGKQVRAYPWGIMVRKVTPFGTAKVGFRQRWATSVNVTTGPGMMSCGRLPVTDADGVTGHPCVVGGLVYFISNDGEVVRPVMALGSPPAYGSFFVGQRPTFSPTEPNVLYATNFGGSNVFKLTYTGNWKDSPWDTEARRFYINSGGDYPYFDENVKWEIAITPNLATQVATKYPEYIAPPYSPWTSGVSFGGISGNVGVFFKTIGGQDRGPCHVAVVNMLTGTLIDMFSTMENGGPLTFGNCHSISANGAVENSVNVSLNILKVNNKSLISGGPFQVKIEAVMAGGTWDSGKSLPWPIDDSYDNQCPTDLPAEFTEFGATGNQCVTFQLAGHPCNIAPSNAEMNDPVQFPECNWNSEYRRGPLLRPGHNFVDPAVVPQAPGDSEHFRVLTVEEIPDSGGRLRVVAQRNASRDYCCRDAAPTCVCTLAAMRHPANFTGMMVPGTKASCNASAITVIYPDGAVDGKSQVELSRTFQGHSAMGMGPGRTFRYISTESAVTVSDFKVLGTQPPIPMDRISNPQFNGVKASIGASLQQYLNHAQSAAPDDKTVYSFDANALNPFFGIGGGNTFGNIVQGGNRVLTHVEGSVWKTTPIGLVDYKNRPLIGWSGHRVLKDVSGPASSIASAPPHSFCYAYNAGECYPDSARGTIYVNEPATYRHPTSSNLCQTAMMFADVPCVVSAEPTMGYIRQFRTNRPDVTGSDQRLVTTALRPYGTHYPFWGVLAHPAGDVVLLLSGGWVQGRRESVLLAKLPPFEDTAFKLNAYGGLNVTIGPRDGMTHARVRFGYNMSYQCTERNEACVTDDNVRPFAFESEATAPAGCANGCSIDVPVIPGRLLYYRVETWDGSAWISDEPVAAAVN